MVSTQSIAPGVELPELLQAALRAVNDGVTVQDRSGRLVFANDAAARIIGVASTAALLASPGQAVLARFEIFAEDGRPFPLDQLPGRVLLAGGAPPEHVLRFRGDVSPFDRWARVRATPVHDENGALVYALNVFRDISAERRAAQRQTFLVRAGEELNASLDWEHTLKTVARLAVPEIADWCAVDMFVGGAVQRLAAAHIDPQKVALVEELARRYPPSLQEPGGYATLRRTGQPQWRRELSPAEVEHGRERDHVELLRRLDLRSYIGVPLKRGDEVVGVITFILAESRRLFDEDDLRLASTLAERASIAIENARLYRELEAANRSKDEFLAVLGHELRNPLAPIVTALDVMKLRPDLPHGHERAIIDRQVKHLTRLVDDLLDVSRITRGRVELEKAPQSVDDLVERAIEMASPLLEGRHHQLDVRVDPGLRVLGDPARLAQVISNLLNNAAKYTDPGGRIELTAAREGTQVVLAVRDNGIGIAPQTLPRIFELFVQESQAIDRAQGGLGLGLSIVRSLVEAHGGTVRARSEGVGRGAELQVSLPAHDGAPEPARAEAAALRAAASERGVRVLVVDDNTDALEVMALALEDTGYHVDRANDGPAALAAAANAPPRIAVLDIGLPVMDGYELARRLRTCPGLEAVKLVAVTGYGQAGDKAKAAGAGFDAHLTKPVSLDRMLETLERLVTVA